MIRLYIYRVEYVKLDPLTETSQTARSLIESGLCIETEIMNTTRILYFYYNFIYLQLIRVLFGA